MLHTAADANGHHGVALWVNTRVDYARAGQRTWRLSKDHLTVTSLSSRHLVVQISAPYLRWTVLVAHAPSEPPAPAGSAQKFWAMCRQALCRRPSGSDIIILADANARLGSCPSDVVGEEAPEQETIPAEAFHALLAELDMFLPSTFTACHEGPSVTWIPPHGEPRRLDYVALPRSWPCSSVRTKVWADFESLQTKADHYPVVAMCSLAARGPDQPRVEGRYQRRAIRPDLPATPEYFAVLRALTASVACNWTSHVDDHYTALVEGWRHAGGTLVQARQAAPRQPYLSRESYAQVQRRKEIRLFLQATHAELRRRRLLIGFAGFLHLLHGTCFAPSAVLRACAWLRDSRCRLATATHQLEVIGRDLRVRVKAERQLYLQGLVDRVALADIKDPKHLFRAVRKAFPGAASRRRQSFAPLPAIELQDGTLATCQEQRQEAWRAHFAELEEGEHITAAQYPGLFRQQRLALPPPRPDFDIRVVPTLSTVEQNILAAKRGKACGPDSITGELLQVDAASSARVLLPVFTKAALGLQEPLEWRGGCLMPLAKQAATAFRCSRFRAILLSNLPSKIYHKHLRSCLVAHMPVTDLQAGALPGLSTEAISLAARAFQSTAMASKAHWSLLYFDVKSAFYCVVRQLLVPVGDTEVALRKMFHKLGLPASALEELTTQLKRLAVIPQTEDSAHLCALVADVLQGTWFRLDRASALTLTHQGTRPGDGLADVLFAFSFAAYLRCADAAITQKGLATQVPPTRGPEPWDTSLIPSNLACGAWADDFVHMHSQPEPIGLCEAVLRVVSCYVEQADYIGMTLGFARDKTAAIIPESSIRLDSDAVVHPGSEGPTLRGHSAVTGKAFALPLVQAYKHLGGITTVSGTPAPEIGYRAAQAWNVVRPFRHRLFSAVGIALSTRRHLLRSLAMTRFTFGSAVLPLHCAFHFRT